MKKLSIPKTKEERIKHYRDLIEYEKSHNYLEGICIYLGNLCGGYGRVPWSSWKDLIKYYPELSVYKPPSLSCIFTINRRKQIIESLALRINKKKDIYRDKLYKKQSLMSNRHTKN